MKNTNIGIANLIISNKLKNSYFENNFINESKKLTSDFLDVINNSPILQLEFKIFNNIENKHIDNDLSATRYIDSNIKLFEIYTAQEITKEHEKLSPFINNEKLDENSSKAKLYNAIDYLIKESLSDYNNIDVDNIHESFTIVLNHIKEPKKLLVESVNELNNINEDVIKIAINKFNEKYDSLNENDAILLKQLMYGTDKDKEELLESYKLESLTLLNNINSVNVKENILKAIQKIKEMKYNKSTVNDDIISLHDLKKDIL